MAHDDSSFWGRGLKVTRKPKSSLLAAQVLNPCYYRDFRRFCDQVAAQYIKRYKTIVTADEVEGAARMWADRAELPPADEIEVVLYAYFDACAPTFIGWTASEEAMVIPLLDDAEE
jgi:hypothetical protein